MSVNRRLSGGCRERRIIRQAGTLRPRRAAYWDLVIAWDGQAGTKSGGHGLAYGTASQVYFAAGPGIQLAT